MNTPAFQSLITEIFDFYSSYTNPASGTPNMHFLYQDTKAPSRLLMITGYQSQNLNTEADKVYAERFLPRMFEFVQHGWLRQLDVDVKALPLEEWVTVACGKRPSEWRDSSSGTGTVNLKGVGGWDVWPDTSQGRKNDNGERGTRDLEENQNGMIWVQVSRWGDGGVDIQPIDGEMMCFRKIMSR